MTIFKQFSDIFHLEGDKLSCTNAVYHEINVIPATQPINESPYHLPFRHKQEIDRQIQKLQEENISRSPWNAPWFRGTKETYCRRHRAIQRVRGLSEAKPSFNR